MRVVTRIISQHESCIFTSNGSTTIHWLYHRLNMYSVYIKSMDFTIIIMYENYWWIYTSMITLGGAFQLPVVPSSSYCIIVTITICNDRWANENVLFQQFKTKNIFTELCTPLFFGKVVRSLHFQWIQWSSRQTEISVQYDMRQFLLALPSYSMLKKGIQATSLTFGFYMIFCHVAVSAPVATWDVFFCFSAEKRPMFCSYKLKENLAQ